jgi:hypothetical protein
MVQYRDYTVYIQNDTQKLMLEQFNLHGMGVSLTFASHDLMKRELMKVKINFFRRWLDI